MQRLMRKLTASFPFVIIFIDDCVVFSKTFDEHIEHCRSVLKAFNDVNLKLNLSKCSFGYYSLEVLGHQVHPNYQSVSPDKLEESNNIPKPTDLKSFLHFDGFFNYLRDYIPRYTEIIAPLRAVRQLDKDSNDWSKYWTILVYLPI